jgi:ATP-dependent DNA helicase RecG
LKALKSGPKSRAEAQDSLSLIGLANFRKRYLEPSMKLGLVGMTIPDKPHSPIQRYGITSLGLEVLKQAR